MTGDKPKRSLLDMAIGEKGVIRSFSSDQLGSKLMAMGVTPGTEVMILRKGLRGHTLLLKVDRQHLAVRKEEAACILLM